MLLEAKCEPLAGDMLHITPLVLALAGGHIKVLLYRNVQRFRGGLVFKAHRLCVSLNSRLESNKEEKISR